MKIFPLVFFLLFFSYSFSQEIIKGRSRPKKFDFKTAYNKNAPPDLYVDLNFFDENSNNVLEPNETANLNLKINNRGKGPAQGLVVSFEDNVTDQEIEIPMRRQISFVFPGKSIDVNIPIKAKSDILTQEHKLKISFKDFYEYEIEPAHLIFHAYKKELKRITLTNYKIPDFYVITGRIINKELQKNSYFKVNLEVKNSGQVATGPINFEIESLDESIKAEFIKDEVSNIEIGDIQTITFSVSTTNELDISNGLKFNISATDDRFKKLLNKKEILISLDRISGGTAAFPPEEERFDIDQHEAYFEYDSKKYNDYVGKIYDIRNIKTSYTSKPHDFAYIIGLERYKSLTSSLHSVNDALLFRSYTQKVLGISKNKIFTNKEFNDTVFNHLIFSNTAHAQQKTEAGKSNIFIYFSGHTVPTANGDDLYITSYDCSLNTMHSCAVKLSDLVKKLTEFNPNSINIILESTLNGKTKKSPFGGQESIHPGTSIFDLNKFKSNLISDKLNIIFASESNQVPLTFQQSSTGLMTYFLFSGMKGDADMNANKIITIEELFKFIQSETKNASQKLNGNQSPQYIINKNIELFEF